MKSVASRYAKALFSLVRPNDTHKRAFVELVQVKRLIENDSKALSYFNNPQISPDQKAAVLKTSLKDGGLLQEVVGLLILLAERNRFSVLPDLVLSFGELMDAESGLTRGILKSSRPLSPDAQKTLEANLGTILKKKIQLTFQEDPSVLGGVIAEVGGWTFDDSIETHLKRMNAELNRGAH